jgi:hypothetical protein
MRNISVLVDFSSGLNLYPDLRLCNNSVQYDESVARIASVLNLAQPCSTHRVGARARLVRVQGARLGRLRPWGFPVRVPQGPGLRAPDAARRCSARWARRSTRARRPQPSRARPSSGLGGLRDRFLRPEKHSLCEFATQNIFWAPGCILGISKE